MPIKEDIDRAIDLGDLAGAQALFDEVLSKNHGAGLSGHDQQIYEHTFEQMAKLEPPAEDEPEEEEPPAKAPRKAKAK